MRVAIIGYGKMGHAIERFLLKRGHEVVLVIDFENESLLSPENLKSVDVAIEFTTPDKAFGNIKKCLESDVPVVCGTTGWNDKIDEVKRICTERGGTFFYSSNFSIGVNIFFAINERLAQLMDSFDQYDISMIETHHTQKKDAPSGTAVTLAEGIINNLKRKTDWQEGEKLPVDTSAITINSIRDGEVPGIHEISYESDEDIINIRHEAKSRNGFAFGAVLAAEFTQTHKGILTMKELLKL